MGGIRILAWIALAVPIAAAAQGYSREAIPGEPVVERFRTCVERNDTLWDRKALIDQDRRVLEQEGEAIARMRAELEERWQGLDRESAGAVAAYNARSMELNRWVESHNRRVAELNGAAALLNANSQALEDYCNDRYVAR